MQQRRFVVKFPFNFIILIILISCRLYSVDRGTSGMGTGRDRRKAEMMSESVPLLSPFLLPSPRRRQRIEREMHAKAEE